MKFSIYQECRQGARTSNQDRVGYIYTPECALLIACDGMGGHLRGDIAAQFVIDFLARNFRQQAVPTKIKNPPQFLLKNILAAHHGLLDLTIQHDLPETPRTTAVVCIVQDGKAWWAHVGDSRLYVLRDGKLFARTMDHSHVQMLVETGQITEEDALHHPERNKIYSCLGQPAVPRVDVNKPVPLKAGDSILLCTDGLWGPLPIKVVATTMARTDLPVGIPMLMDMAEALSGHECDNLSGVAITWFGTDDNVTPVQERLPPNERDIDDDDVAIAIEMIRAMMQRRAPEVA
jgi:serine/threonine protein phosphatase PrpC